MQTTAARLSRLAPELPATDIRASIQYYMERLGFSLAMQMTAVTNMQTRHSFESSMAQPL